jgi:hypothetical protein
VRQTPPEDPFYEPSATPISPDSVFHLSSPTWYSPPPSQPRDNRRMFSPAGENPSQSYRDDRGPIYDDRNFSQRSSRYSQQVSPVSPQHHPKEVYHEVSNWPLPSYRSFPKEANMDGRGGSSSEDSLGDPKGIEKSAIDTTYLAPPRPRGASSYAQRGDSWARRSDPFDLDRDSRCL